MLIKHAIQTVRAVPLNTVYAAQERRIVPVNSKEFRYLRFRAIGNMEVAGFNGNIDGFPYEYFEDDEPGYGYKSFINKRAHSEHNSNLGILGSIGDLPDAYLNKFNYPDDIPEKKWASLLNRKFDNKRIAILNMPNQRMGDIEVLMRIDTTLVNNSSLDKKTRQTLDRIIRMIDTGQTLTCSMGCYAPGAKVLLSDGTYKNIENMRRYDRVLTHTGSWSYVQDTTIHSYEGDMYKLTVSSLPAESVMLTPEHPVWGMKGKSLCACGCGERVNSKKHKWKDGHVARVFNNNKEYTSSYLEEQEERIEILQEDKLEWLYAKDLVEGDYVSYPISREEIPSPHITPGKARLIGYFLAEGSYLKYKPKKGKSYKTAAVFSFGYTEKDKPFIEEVVRLCKEEWPEVDPKIYELSAPRATDISGKSCIEIRLHKKYIAQFFEFYCGEYSKHKKVPEEVLTWPKYLQMKLLGAYFNGDGGKDRHGVFANTISETLAYQISYLLKRIKIPHGFEVGEWEYSTNIIYTLRIRSKWQQVLEEFWSYEYEPKSRDMSSYDIFDNYILMPIRKIEKIPYKGPVYNLDVAGDHSFVASGFATHNTNVAFSVCSACGNNARFSSDYCDHLTKRKGALTVVTSNEIRDLLDKEVIRPEWLKHITSSKYDANDIINGMSNRGIPVRNGEINHKLSFFELSIVDVPAYSEALMLEKLAKQANGNRLEYLERLRKEVGDENLLDLYSLMQQDGKISTMCEVR